MNKGEFLDRLLGTKRTWTINEGGYLEDAQGNDPAMAVARNCGYDPTPLDLRREQERDSGHLQAILPFLEISSVHLDQILTACTGEETPDDPTLRHRLLRACGLVEWPGVRNGYRKH